MRSRTRSKTCQCHWTFYKRFEPPNIYRKLDMGRKGARHTAFPPCASISNTNHKIINFVFLWKIFFGRCHNLSLIPPSGGWSLLVADAHRVVHLIWGFGPGSPLHERGGYHTCAPPRVCGILRLWVLALHIKQQLFFLPGFGRRNFTLFFPGCVSFMLRQKFVSTWGQT